MSIGTSTSDGGRFRVLRPHARGGLGAVFVALDSELNREVALKQILDHHADDQASRQRFVLEAEITGGLEHPGIVPVYGLGTYGDGRPYYAMRFIRGDSLKEAINRFHAAARALNVPIIHVKSVLRRDGVDDVNGIKSAWRFVFPLHVGPIPNSDQHAREGSRWTRFVTEVAQGDYVVETKKRLSAFYPTDLDFLLRNMGVKRLVLNGCMTDCCVLNTAFDASNLGYRVTVCGTRPV